MMLLRYVCIIKQGVIMMFANIRKRFIMILAIVVAFTGFGLGVQPVSRATAAELSPYNLKIMTFNIRNGGSGSGDQAWDVRKDRVVNAIDSFGPDVLGMQEGYQFQIDYLLGHLNGPYASIGISRFGNTTNEYNNIMYRSDKFEVVESGQFWLSDTPDIVGSKSPYDTAWPRICTWAKFRSKDNNKAEFYYFNTHFGLTEGAQEQAAYVILDRIAKYAISPNAPVLLGGDLNVQETSNAFLALQNSDLNDTWADAGHSYTDDDGTYSNFDGSTTTGHIDWIFQRNVRQIQSIQINRYNENGHYPSDHYPVQLVVDIPLTGDPAPDRTNFGSPSSQYTDSPAGEDITKAFDHNKLTKYYTPHGTAWIQFRFANESQFVVNRYRISSANDNQTTRDPKNWTVKGSNDGVNWVTLDTRSNQSFELRFQTKEYTFNNATGFEYIRLEITSNGGSALQLSELQLFDYVNVARNAAVSADGYRSGETPEKAVDGTTVGNSKWCSVGSEPHWLQLDLGVRHNFTQFVILHAAAGGENADYNTVAYQIQVSDNGTDWTSEVNVANNKANATTHQVNTFGRYVRLLVTDSTARNGDNSARIYELGVYGQQQGATFYKDGSYGGYAVSLPKGKYTLAELQEAGIRNDDITSLRIYGGATVELYWDNNFQGSKLTLTADQTSLSPYGWNDKTSSLRIY
ncbi:hypothetical protein DQG13_04010 [Paenibacillus sp. YN15]|nr:hypothetical protein DQG13_04010 [Paenibacillus sp. YN15]